MKEGSYYALLAMLRQSELLDEAARQRRIRELRQRQPSRVRHLVSRIRGLS
jgi:hypothetical protein